MVILQQNVLNDTEFTCEKNGIFYIYLTWLLESASQSLCREHLGGSVECTVWLTHSAYNGSLPLGGCWTLTQLLVTVTRVEFEK